MKRSKLLQCVPIARKTIKLYLTPQNLIEARLGSCVILTEQPYIPLDTVAYRAQSAYYKNFTGYKNNQSWRR